MNNQQVAHAVRKDQRPILLDGRKHSTSNACDRWSRVWNLARYTNCSIYETALSLLDERHRKVLDVGCGTGVMSTRLAMSGRQVMGVDLSPAMIDRARRKEHPKLEFIQGDAENLPLESGSFDAVINLISFHHYPTPARAISEFQRVLRPNGRLVLIAFDRESRYIQLAQKTNRWTRWIAGQSWQKMSEEVMALMSDAGFVRVELKPVRYWIQTFAIVAE